MGGGGDCYCPVKHGRLCSAACTSSRCHLYVDGKNVVQTIVVSPQSPFALPQHCRGSQRWLSSTRKPIFHVLSAHSMGPLGSRCRQMANPCRRPSIASNANSSFIRRRQNRRRQTRLRERSGKLRVCSTRVRGGRAPTHGGCKQMAIFRARKRGETFSPAVSPFIRPDGLVSGRRVSGGRGKVERIAGWTSCHDDRVAPSVCWLMKSLLARLSNQMAEQRSQHEQERTRLQRQQSAEKDSLVQEHQREVGSLEEQVRATLQQHQQQSQERRKCDAQVGGLHSSTDTMTRHSPAD